MTQPAIASPKELRGMPETELRAKILELRQELTTLRPKAQRGAIEQPHRIRQLKRGLARMLTILSEQTPLVGTAQEPPRA